MKLVFFDESGYSFNWLSDLSEQPFYVLSAVAVDAAVYARACKEVQESTAALELPGLKHPLGKGAEIKARQVSGGNGWWRDHESQRNAFRNLMLGFPKQYNGAAFLVVIDKARHFSKYANPIDPVKIGLQFLFERLEWYLRGIDDNAYCIYDHDKRRTDAVHSDSTSLMRSGSKLEFLSSYYGETIVATHDLSHITELALGASTNSIGLQIADFFANCAYKYFRDGRSSPCGWWDLLTESLYREGSGIEGHGLKTFS